MNEERLLTVRDIAQRQNVGVDFVKRALNNRRLRGHQVGDMKRWRVTEADYAAWVAEGAPTGERKVESEQA